jgi:hypothetical protein
MGWLVFDGSAVSLLHCVSSVLVRTPFQTQSMWRMQMQYKLNAISLTHVAF